MSAARRTITFTISLLQTDMTLSTSANKDCHVIVHTTLITFTNWSSNSHGTYHDQPLKCGLLLGSHFHKM
jgi:hypothetical protein